MSTINITKKNSSLFKTDVSAVVSLFFLVSGLSHTIPFCSMFCLTDFEEWETVHSLPLFNPLNPNIKIQILICYPYKFPIETVGRIC